MRDKDIILGVSGGIAAYKACELASRLTQEGARVHAVLTESAQRFVSPLTFAALTQQSAHSSLWPTDVSTYRGPTAAIPHIALADRADAVIIAPASANIIARLANGLADDLLTTLALATSAPVLVAPAMNPAMLAHPATQRNLALLRDMRYIVIEPVSGRMACEHVGAGRLPETQVLLDALSAALTPTDAENKQWEGRKVLITAGPTRESLDPVRFISNRSSGKMGYALAQVAAARGARTVLVSGPTHLPTPPGVQRINVTTTEEMLANVLVQTSDATLVIGAAAPVDFRAAVPASRKIKKRELAGSPLNLELVPTPDIIGTVGQWKTASQIVIGFAAETHDVAGEARRKLEPKHLDAIVANDVTQSDAGFDADTNRVLWITPDSIESWPLLSKREVAGRILDYAARLLEQREDD